MDGRSRWQRFDAEHWVHVAGIVLTTVLVLWTLWVALVGLIAGLLLSALVPGAIAALAGWLTSAWRRELPWSWWVWTVLATLTVLVGLADPGPATLAWLVAGGGLLILLVHPDSRARVQAPAPSRPRGVGRRRTRLDDDWLSVVGRGAGGPP
jgi:hypothetical protein